MRLWKLASADGKAPTRRDYETVGYVIDGAANLHLEGQTVRLREVPVRRAVFPEIAYHALTGGLAEHEQVEQ